MTDHDGVTETDHCPYCSGEHTEAERVPVVAGNVLGQYDHPKPHYRVTGDGTSLPEVSLWCPHRYRAVFDTEPQSTYVHQFERVRRFLTSSTVWAFVVGSVLTALLFVLFAA